MILKHSKTKWIELNDKGLKLLIDYPTIQQAEKLKELMFEMAFINPEIAGGEHKDLTAEESARMAILIEKIAKYRVKFCVKDWEGVTTEDEKPAKIRLINNEIDNKQFEPFVRCFNYEEIILLSRMIEQETEFNEADKKK